MKIGMIVAILDEFQHILNDYGSQMVEITQNGYTVYKCDINGNELYVARSGAGEIGAASTTQLLITAFNVELVVNYGVVGALDPTLALCDTVVVKDVVHYDFDTSAYDNCEVGRYIEFDSTHVKTSEKYLNMALEIDPSLKAVSCASGDKFVEGAIRKKELKDTFDCQICEMEAAGITLTCVRNGVDCLLIKAISDSATGGAEEFGAMVKRSAQKCMNVLMTIIKNL